MKRVFHCVLCGFIALIGMSMGAKPASAQFSYLPTLYNGPLALCALGINGGLGSFATNPLRLGWFIDYTATAPQVAGVSYFPVIRLQQTSNGYSYSLFPGRISTSEAQLRARV